jgi:hypothetical protein
VCICLNAHVDRNLCGIAQFGYWYVTVCSAQRTYVFSGVAWPGMDDRGRYKMVSELIKASEQCHLWACWWPRMLQHHIAASVFNTEPGG